MKQEGPNLGKLDKKQRVQERVRDLYQQEKTNLRNARQYKADVRESMREPGKKLRSIIGLAIFRLNDWNGPRNIRLVQKWAGKYGKDLEDASNQYQNRIAETTETLRAYMAEKYGVDMHNLDPEALPAAIEDDEELREKIVDALT